MMKIPSSAHRKVSSYRSPYSGLGVFIVHHYQPVQKFMGRGDSDHLHLSICCALTSFCLVNIFHYNVVGNCEFSLKYVKLRGFDGEAVLGAFGLLKYSIEMIPHGGS